MKPEIVLPTSMPVPSPPSETTAIILMIERAARDPAVDIDKMQRLFEMHQRAEATRARLAYDAAFAAMQPDLPEIDKRGKIVIRDKNDRETIIQSTPYALWDDTNKLIKPILSKHGFSLSFRISQTDSRLTTTAVLAHTGGHREETSFASPIDSTGSKNNVQGWGSVFSYGKRYTGTALLNITTKGEDDDGNKAGEGPPPADAISPEQLDTLREMIEASGADIKGVCTYYKIARIDDLPAARFGHAMAKLEERMQR